MRVRPPAVAGSFYPDDPELLRVMLQRLLRDNPCAGEKAPKALIAPHAGYVYSGPVAARAYNRLVPLSERISRVVLLGPAHYHPVQGLALPTVEAFATPLGPVPLDTESMARLGDLPQVKSSDMPHAPEHSLEVQLPFLQILLRDFRLVPLVVGDAAPEAVAEVLDRLWGGDETLIVISSDLSHYHPYAEARDIDAATDRAIRELRSDLDGEQACGCHPINGLMVAACRHGLQVAPLDLRNSGDTAGDKRRVVGYGAYALN
ncbi:MAG: AmmeMemoRadiSam system protein B [Nevskiales bacterium]